MGFLRLIVLWSVLLFNLVCALEIPSAGPAQEVFSSSELGESAGIIRRFSTQPERGWDARAILEAAQVPDGDIWQITPSHVDIYIPPSKESLTSSLHNAGLPSHDIVLPMSLSSPQQHRTGSGESWNLSSFSNTTFHSAYHPLMEIYGFAEELTRLHPELIDVVSLGHSAEGREMFALRISKGGKILKRKDRPWGTKPSQNAKKVGIVITGAQHAREWIATATAMYLTHALVSDPSEPHSMAGLLNHYDFHIVLVPNPDGYIYSWDHDRFWYKNRQIIGPHEKCVGVDMNRNWGYKWKPTAKFPALHPNTSDASPDIRGTDPCSPWYPGHRSFESPEVNNIANYVTTLPALQAFVDLRSYGQMLSAPYSYSCKKKPKDLEDQLEAAIDAARAIKEVHGAHFNTGTLCSMLYKAPGNIVDYMYAKVGIKYAYAAHLRDTGTYGFALPPEWIRPVGEETGNMIRALAGFITAKLKL